MAMGEQTISTCAALTYWYRLARPHESTSEWHYDPNTDMWSRQVAEFMTGLEKTKARAGETSNSARALTIHDMHSLYDQCLPPSATGPAVLRQGIVCYAVSLEFESINMLLTVCDLFEVCLKTWKQAQTGVGHSWKLFANDDNPKICPVRALICLARLYDGEKINESGPLFLKVDGNGAVHQNSPMTSSMLSRALATDLQNIGNKSWALYGTHSFCRGGCQHRIKDSKWTIDMVAAWGGWSQVEAVTMFRYFYSPNDNHEFMAEYDRNEPKRQHVGQKELKG
ncbi:hypothetical protein F5887DRAFT_913789 [Amanita rubescens]|nr:hypothetical protein F5887DRAFT_913789 [Amanita rubescens]